MKLYFLRHAEAFPGEDDATRELTPFGRKQVRVLARFLKHAEVRFDAAYSSPLVRAQQTAQLLLEHVQSPATDHLQTTAALLNETSLPAFAQWVRCLPAAKHVLLVGHMPSLSAHISRMLGTSRSDALDLAKGALTCLKTDDDKTARLKFSVSPSILGL